MLDAVNLLLHTDDDNSGRSDWWRAVKERRESGAELLN
jgi:hypothetical protein